MNPAKRSQWTSSDLVASLATLGEALARMAWEGDSILAANVYRSGVDGAIEWTEGDRYIFPIFQNSLGGVHPCVEAATQRFTETCAAAGIVTPMALWSAWWVTPALHLQMQAPVCVLRAGEQEAVERYAEDWTSALIAGLKPSRHE